MKKLGIAMAVAIASVGAAHAADLPTKKEAPPAPPVNCFSSLWDYMNSTAGDCPLTYGPFTAYLTLDWGFGWESHGAGYNAAYNNGVSNIVTKQSGPRSEWLQTPNGINQSVVGVKVSQPIAYGWSIVGTAEMGFNPYWGYLADAERSQVQNNGKALTLQNANADSSRSGQWDNSQGFLGVSNPVYGTLTAGRVNTLSLDSLISYDPMSSAYAFSPFGYSGSFAGFGDTELARANTGVKYRDSFPNFGIPWVSSFRVGGLAQWGGYDQGNGATQLWQGQVGADFNNLFNSGGKLSVDFLGDYAQNAVNLGTFTGSCSTLTKGPFAGETGCVSGIPQFYDNTDLKATLSNNTGFMALAKYTWGPLAVSGGYARFKQSDPSSTFNNGFRTIGGWNVPATIPSTFPDAKKLWPTQWISYTTYAEPRIAPFWFFGAKYAVTPQLDVAAAFYYLSQTDYNSSTTPCANTNTTFVEPNGQKFTVSRSNNSACAGSEDFISFLIDYRPVKRVDLYAGVMISNVYGGLANGFQVSQTINPTAGLRIKF
jgi:predicted porin